ncbi:hypothetical protein GGX14DRAFT_448593 [Mycena pura]|uniref:Uncharacterized protein n=1 Tax=Mycena pura TaxID=153505 RepID=A0AAD6VKM0_9AGAR|nr:hypothetical protein GGX14DRAFT_448593 [Mycena pura]
MNRRLLKLDQRDFITGSATVGVQAAHLLNAIRARKHRGKMKKVKEEMEAWLTELWFNRGSLFELDKPANLILVRNDFHTLLDLIIFALTQQLEADNKKWDERASQDPKARRNLTAPIYTHPHRWSILVLHPAKFLPKGEKLYALPCEKRTIHRSGQQYTPPPGDDWKGYTVDNRNEAFPLLVHNDIPLEVSFESRCSARKEEEMPSLFAMIVVLYAKLKALDGHNYSSILLLPLVQKMVQQIFHSPHANAKDRLVAAISDVAMAKKEASATAEPKRKNPFTGKPSSTTSPSARVHDHSPSGSRQYAGSGDNSNHDAASSEDDSRAKQLQCDNAYLPTTSTGQMSPSSSLLRVPVGGYDDPAAPPIRPEEVVMNGLTATELKTVLAQAAAPGRTKAQEADAAMMLLFGPHGTFHCRPQCLSHTRLRFVLGL